MGQREEKAEERDLLLFFIRCCTVWLAFMMCFVSIIFGKVLWTSCANSSMVEGIGPMNLSYMCAISVSSHKRKGKNSYRKEMEMHA